MRSPTPARRRLIRLRRASTSPLQAPAVAGRERLEDGAFALHHNLQRPCPGAPVSCRRALRHGALEAVARVGRGGHGLSLLQAGGRVAYVSLPPSGWRRVWSVLPLRPYDRTAALSRSHTEGPNTNKT